MGPVDDRQSDGELVCLAQQSPRVFDLLYRRYWKPVTTYCYRQLGNWDDAEDASSASFVAALDNLANFRDRGNSFRAWLFTIVRNEIGMRRRRQIRHPIANLEAAGEVIDPGRSPEEEAERADGQARIAELLSTLPSRERDVIDLRLAGLTTAEIAAALAISLQNVRTAQSRALARLRAALGDGDVSDGEVNAYPIARRT